MLTKVCSKCCIEKSVDRYSKQTKGKLGVRPDCKDCAAARKKIYYKTNRETILTKNKAYYKVYYYVNYDYIAARTKTYNQSNREVVASQKRAYKQANQDKINASAAHRRATKLQATPLWADTKAVMDFYIAAQMFRLYTGDDYHVDHIVPLKSDLVCGLHCEANLQLLPASDNTSKGNRWWPDMW